MATPEPLRVCTSSGLPVSGVAPPRTHAARLERLAVAARGDLAVALLPRQPDLDVVGLRGGESDVAGAQRDDPIREAEAREDGLGMGREHLQRVVGLVRADDVHQLHFLELMLAQHPSRVLAVRPRLAAKAGRVADEPHRQFLGLQNPIARDVGDRDLRGRNQVEVVLVNPEQIVGELRELAGAAQRLGRDQVRDVDLVVAVLARVHVEHELDEGAVQVRERSAQADEPAARKLRRKLEVHTPERNAQVGVILRLEVEVRRLPDPALLAVVVLVPALGHGLVGEVGGSPARCSPAPPEAPRAGSPPPSAPRRAAPRPPASARCPRPRPSPARLPSSACCARAAAPGYGPEPPCAPPRAGRCGWCRAPSPGRPAGLPSLPDRV